MTKTPHDEALDAARKAFSDAWSSNVYGADPLEAAIKTYLSKSGEKAWLERDEHAGSDSIGRLWALSNSNVDELVLVVTLVTLNEDSQPDSRKEVVPFETVSRENRGTTAGHVTQPPQEEAGEADNAGASAEEDIVGRLERGVIMAGMRVDDGGLCDDAMTVIERLRAEIRFLSSNWESSEKECQASAARIKELEDLLSATASRLRYDGDAFHDQGNFQRRDLSWEAADEVYRTLRRSTLSKTQG